MAFKRWAKRLLLLVLAIVVIPCLILHGICVMAFSRLVTNARHATIVNLATICSIVIVFAFISTLFLSGGMMMFTDISILFPTQTLFLSLRSANSSNNTNAFSHMQDLSIEIQLQVRPGLVCICWTALQLLAYLALTIVCLALYILLLVVCYPLQVFICSFATAVVLAYIVL